MSFFSTFRTLSALSFAVAPLGLSCSVALVESGQDSSPLNQCIVDSDCIEGSCSEGICQSVEAEFSAVLLEVVPNLGVPKVGGLRFLVELDSLDRNLFLELPSVSEFVGKVTGADVVPEACVTSQADESVDAAPDGTLPVRLSLLPRPGVFGISTSPFTTEITPGADASYGFEIQVPPGQYDMYVEPLGAEGKCVRPPYLALNQVLEPGQISADLDLPIPERLTMLIEREEGASSLDGWEVSIVEQDSARRLSNVVQLSAPTKVSQGFQYEVDLAFSSVQGDDSAPATELVRLVPPEGQVAPTIFFQRSVVELFDDDLGLINGLGDFGQAVNFKGSVRAAQGVKEPIAPSLDESVSDSVAAPLASSLSSITFVARELAQVPSGVTVEFSQIIETNEEGDYEVDLLPGVYTVFVQPMSEALAQVEIELEVFDDSREQQPQELELPERINLAGEVLSSSGESVPGASVLTLATPASQEEVLSPLTSPTLGGPSVVIVRNSQTQTDEQGTFDLFADIGAVDLVARSANGSGYPWAIDVGYEVNQSTLKPESLRFSEPYLVDGFLTFADAGAVNGALIRTYAYANESGITEDAAQGTRLVQIGESRVDETGGFQLYLPSSFE